MCKTILLAACTLGVRNSSSLIVTLDLLEMIENISEAPHQQVEFTDVQKKKDLEKEDCGKILPSKLASL